MIHVIILMVLILLRLQLIVLLTITVNTRDLETYRRYSGIGWAEPANGVERPAVLLSLLLL